MGDRVPAAGWHGALPGRALPDAGDYIAAGGPENSGGVYMSGDKTFRIPFESLGIKRLGESYTRDVDFSNDTLVHEITHQLMHDYLPFCPSGRSRARRSSRE